MCLENSYPGAACFHFTTALSSCCLSLRFSPEVLIIEIDEKAALAWMDRACKPYIASACWGKATFIQNFPQLESCPYTNNFLRGQKMLLPIGQVEQNRIQNLVFSVLQMKRQHLCQGDTRVQLHDKLDLTCHHRRKLSLPSLQGSLPPP